MALCIFLAIFYIETLLARYLKIYVSQSLYIWYTDLGWGVDYLINFRGNSVKFSQSYGPLQFLTIFYIETMYKISSELLPFLRGKHKLEA